MRKGRNTGLINLLRVKTVVFTGILAGAMALSGCNGGGGKGGLSVARPGQAGPAGAAGRDGSPAQVVVSAGIHCTQMSFEPGSESGRLNRLVVVVSVDDKLQPLANTQLANQYTDEKGCLDLQVVANSFNKVTVTQTTGTSGSFSFFINGGKPALPPTTARLVTIPMGDATQYLLGMQRTNIYNVKNVSTAGLNSFYDGLLGCSDLRDDWENSRLGSGTKLGAGFESIVKCLQSTPALLQPFASSMFVPFDGKYVTREFDSAGTALANNTSFLGGTGTQTYGDGNYSIIAGSASNCSLDFIATKASTVTYQISGNTILAADSFTSCVRTDFDKAYEGIHGTKTIGALGMTAEYGVVLLARGTDNTADAGSYEYVSALIAYFGAKSTTTAVDMNMSTGDYQDYNLSNFYPGKNTLIMISNQEEDDFDNAVATTPDNGVADQVDEDTNWMIFQSVTSSTVFASGTAPATYFDDALLSTTANASLFLECNPSKAVKFTLAAHISNPTTVLAVRQQTTEPIEFAVASEVKFRVMAGSMLIALANVSDPEGLGALAEATTDRIKDHPVMSLLANNYDVLTSAGAISIAPVELLEMIARTGALCVPEVVDIGGGSATEVGDDMLPVKLNSDGVITDFITFAGSSRPNFVFSGVAPFHEAEANCQTADELANSSLYGLVSGYCDDATVKSIDLTVGIKYKSKP